ncbi:MAG TPA: sec-independent translocase [Jatrophihabitans sp.]|jgi:sec-independent protein translocase protein TatB
MFNVGPMEFVVLALVAVIVLGPDRLPQFARDAANLLRTLRELATGARTQLRDELGPEFADMDLRNLNPRTAIQRAILGDEENGLRGELRKYDPRQDLRDMDPRHASSYYEPEPEKPVSMHKPEQRPLGRGEPAPYDSDAT